MKFARTVFLAAGIYGLLVLVPQFFLEQKIGREQPPEITHPEYFYGFLGVAVAWQVLFLILARDPMRYRLLMLPSALEKASFAIAVPLLYLQHRVQPALVPFALLDLMFGVLFIIAFRRTRASAPAR